MLSKTVDLRNELVSERRKSCREAAILAEVERILSANGPEPMSIRDSLAAKSDCDSNDFVFDLLETENIFHVDQIRNVCVNYRLRFLNSSFFKNVIPEEAVEKISRLELEHGTKIEGFKIAAPSKAFKLMNYDDPLLFAPLGNDYYYLVHKWGNDMSAIRKWLVLPVKNLWNFLIFCLLVSALVTTVIPENNLSRTVPMATIIVFLFAFKSIFAVVMYAFFMTGRKFNTGMWDSKFYNN
jgi:hypothetical protein